MGTCNRVGCFYRHFGKCDAGFYKDLFSNWHQFFGMCYNSAGNDYSKSVTCNNSTTFTCIPNRLSGYGGYLFNCGNGRRSYVSMEEERNSAFKQWFDLRRNNEYAYHNKCQCSRCCEL